MKIKLSWQTGIPSYADMYLVAVRVGGNVGYYAFSYWDGTEWRDTLPQDIIAFYPANKFLGEANIEWPEPETHFDESTLTKPDSSPDQFIDCTDE